MTERYNTNITQQRNKQTPKHLDKFSKTAIKQIISFIIIGIDWS